LDLSRSIFITLTPASIVISPPFPKIGPGVEGDEMVWFLPLQPAHAAPGIASAASAKTEAPASSAARKPRP
jgi:hypothetical protein